MTDRIRKALEQAKAALEAAEFVIELTTEGEEARLEVKAALDTVTDVLKEEIT